MNDILSLVAMLLAVAVILYLSYIVSRRVGTGMLSRGMSKNIHIIDRTYVDRDKSVIIIKVGEKYYLLGVSNAGVRLLTELEEGQVNIDESGSTERGNFPSFADILKGSAKNKNGLRR